MSIKGVTAVISSMFGTSQAAEQPVDPYPPRWTHQDLMNAVFPPRNWIIDRLVADESLTILGGKQKLGKSWLCLQMAQAVAGGNSVLDRATCRGTVLYLALEDGPRRLRERLRKQSAQEELPILYQTRLAPLNASGMDDLVEIIETEHPKLIIIDTLAAAKSGKVDENAAGDMGDLFNRLRQVAQDRHLGILVVAHHGKTTGRGTGDDLRGSSATPAAADIVLGLYKDDSGNVLKAEGRDIEGAAIRISFDSTDTCTWRLVSDARQIAQGQAEAEVVAAVRELGEADAEEVAEHLGKARATVQVTLKRLRETGVLNSRTEPGSSRILYSVNSEG